MLEPKKHARFQIAEFYLCKLRIRLAKNFIIWGLVGLISVLVACFNWDASRPLWIVSWAFIGLIAFVSLGVALDSQVKREEYYFKYHKKLSWLRGLSSDQLASIHQRANHEDILHATRLGIFLTFNAFVGVVIGVSTNPIVPIVFAVLGFSVGWCWIRWAGDAAITIRVLRDAGVQSIDEKLWNYYVRKLGRKFGALSIFNTIIPTLICLAWLTIGLYYTYPLAFDP